MKEEVAVEKGMKDQQTHRYFDRFTPHYNPRRFDFAIEYLNRHSSADGRLIDIGCGDGATLYLIKEKTQLRHLTGLDISRNYLDRARERVGCDVIEGSILDDGFVDEYANRYDYCTLGAVLHHLIGRTRRESFRYASQCLENSMRLLKPEGCLLMFEPTHAPSILMDIVFWTKKTVGLLADQRIELLSRWANVGQPVVSYYTPRQIHSFLAGIANSNILEEKALDRKRLGFVIKRVGLGVILQKSEA